MSINAYYVSRPRWVQLLLAMAGKFSRFAERVAARHETRTPANSPWNRVDIVGKPDVDRSHTTAKHR